VAATHARRGLRRDQEPLSLRRLVVTTGEPAGVGPDLALAAALLDWPAELVFAGDPGLLAARAAALGLTVTVSTWRDETPPAPHRAGTLPVLPLALAREAVAGRPDPANARYVLGLLDAAVARCRGGRFDAMVTAPVQKSSINDAGIPFRGHTEYLAGNSGGVHPVMLLVAGRLRVALATTHLPLAEVPRALSRESLVKTLKVLDADLRRRFRIAQPRILVAGLNPHSGESGHLGREDIEIIEPAIRESGVDASGPIPADTLFVPERLKHADAVLAMYHDQGLPVIKFASFGRGVNVTLGLPFVRTSVDHGTALDLAGTGKADPGSLIEAVNLAIELATASVG
jgi:4-hydroxythreonine-4-phosphate dehydrogenase